ncbi:hypothetical protein ROHU_024334 [Labeo rohita]|uniref:Uncharacterized protein n=1 Tax=Labeo rohita TaxID=84645 RepID=A0A498MLE1_LABRO|nr:hypothetical protein ROHU_026634 [Labeo rohita]RXN21251.1 hypothetical protein ROHU_024334 [Labeo rohita]
MSCHTVHSTLLAMCPPSGQVFHPSSVTSATPLLHHQPGPLPCLWSHPPGLRLLHRSGLGSCSPPSSLWLHCSIHGLVISTAPPSGLVISSAHATPVIVSCRDLAGFEPGIAGIVCQCSDR